MCLSLQDGYFISLDSLLKNIYGIGLSYAGHIKETASDFDPDIDPPVFKKAITSKSHGGAKVKVPTHEDLIEAIEQIEPGIGEKINEGDKRTFLPA